MAAPSYSLGTEFLNASNYAGINHNVGSPTVNQSGQLVQVLGVTYVAGSTYFIEYLINTTHDLTGQLAFIFYVGSTRTNAPIDVGLRSGAGNYVVFGKSDYFYPINQKGLATIDPAATPKSSAGNFDVTAVDGVRIEWTPTRNDSNRNMSLITSYYGTAFTASDGEAGDEITAPEVTNYLDVLNTNVSISNESAYPFRSLDLSLRIPFPFTLASGSTEDISDLLFAQDPLDQPEVSITALSQAGFTDNRTGVTKDQLTLRNIDLPYPVTLASNSTYTNLVANGPTTFTIPNDTNAQGLVADATGLISGGLAVELDIQRSTAGTVYQWNGVADLSGSRFNCPGANYGIDFENASWSSGATFDASEITFTVDPAVRKFRLNAPGKTLNLDVGSTGFIASDVEVVAGTLVVVADQLTLTVANLPTGCEVRIYDLDNTLPDFGSELAGIESLSGTSFEWVHSQAGDDVFLQVFADGFKEYGEVIRLLSVSQTINSNGDILEAEDAF
ncbi:MAG: hypothetical protein AAGA46_03360 [Cyanobacteria bacterium P01_F01_bin.13]